MFSSLNVRKVARVVASSTVAGAAMAVVFLGGPAEAATVSKVILFGRGY